LTEARIGASVSAQLRSWRRFGLDAARRFIMKRWFGALGVVALAMAAQPASAALFGGPDAVIPLAPIVGCPAVPPPPPEPPPAPAALEVPPPPATHPHHQTTRKKATTARQTAVEAPKPDKP